MSNVPKSEQNETSLDYFTLASDIRLRIVNYIFKDLGPELEVLPDGSLNPDYKYVIRIHRKIYDYLADMIANLTQAENIRITSKFEYQNRRRYLTDAIGNCKQVIQEIHFGIELLHLKPSKYEDVIEQLETLIKSIGNRKKSDNKILSRL